MDFKFSRDLICIKNCLWLMALMIVCRHLFEALNCFPLAMTMADWHVDRPIFDRRSHQFCPKMVLNRRLMCSHRSFVAEYCFAVAGIDCRGRLKMLDWFVEAEKIRKNGIPISNWAQTMNANSSSLAYKNKLHFILGICVLVSEFYLAFCICTCCCCCGVGVTGGDLSNCADI